MASLDELLQQLGFGGVTRNRAGQIVTNTNDVVPGAMAGLADTLYGAGRGTLAGTASIAGFPGDINQMYVNNLGALYPNAPAAPTSEQVSKAVRGVIPKLNLSKSNAGDVTSSLGEYVVSPLVSPGSVVKAGRALAPNAAEMAYKYIGPGSKLDPAMYVYRPSTPLKPDPTIGTRFEREYIGGLAEKTPVKIEDLKGSSLMLMPWDSTSRNYRIKSISDEPLANQMITHGGQDYARDLSHISQNIGGASNLGIAKRIQKRDAQSRIENLQAGGTGQVISLPTTMGEYSEFFSVMPTQAVFGLLDAKAPSKKTISEIDNAIRNSKVPGEDKLRMKNFKGLMSEEGRIQLLTGEGLDTTAGNARIAVMQKLALKGNQEKLGFNIEDLSAALTDPALAGVPKGYVGNTVLSTGQGGMSLRPSINPSYNTDFTANYLGTLGQNVPLETLFPKTFDRVLQEMAGKKGSVRNMAIGALEKRKENFSEFVDQQVIDNYYNYLEQQRKLGLVGN
jgi:hypothetical protein